MASCRDALNSLLLNKSLNSFDAMVTRYEAYRLDAVTNAQELNLYIREDNPGRSSVLVTSFNFKEAKGSGVMESPCSSYN